MPTTLDKILDETRTFGYDADSITRVAWTLACNPVDPTAGRLIRMLGADVAFTTLYDSNATEYSGIVELRERKATFTAGSVARALDVARRYNMELLTPEHSHWPTGPNDLGDAAPFMLWARGDTSLLLNEPMTSIIGTRVPTGYGEHMTMEIAADLVDRGNTIVSYGSYGIAGMAHRSTLAAKGKTIAILAGGLDRLYPQGHDALLTRVAEAGVLIAESAPGAPPTRNRFEARNRLVAAIAQRTVVVEASYRSGSLNVVGHALALKRPVGAVPGPVTSAASAGCHRLLRDQQALLVTSASDVEELLPADGTRHMPRPAREYKQMLEQAKTAEAATAIAAPARTVPAQLAAEPQPITVSYIGFGSR